MRAEVFGLDQLEDAEVVIYDRTENIGGLRRLPALLFLFVTTALMAADLTVIFLAMRAVLNVGGSCADGGPFVSTQSCPDGAGGALAIGIPGLFLFGGLLVWASARAKAPQIVVFAWPALFISLGWNFLDYSFNTPDGTEVSLLVCGIVFVIMGLGPLLFGLKSIRKVRTNPEYADRLRMLQAARQRTKAEARSARSNDPMSYLGSPSSSAPYGSAPHGRPSHGTAPAHDPGSPLLSDLERLARLRSTGALTDAEFEAAKQAALRRGDHR